MRITRHEEFEVAHLLPGYDGGCGNLHGHTYKIEVTLEGPQNSEYYDMVMDFKELKQIIKEVVPDHRFVYYKHDVISKEIVEVLDKYDIKSVCYDTITTAENMVTYFAHEIQNKISNEDIKVVQVKLWETTNSYAEWRIEDEH